MTVLGSKPLSRRRFLKLAGVTALALACPACSPAAARTVSPAPTHTPTPAPTATPIQVADSEPRSLRELAAAQKIQIGAGITGWWFTDAAHRDRYKALISREFGLAVVHWGLYWRTIEPSQGQFDFSIADRQVSFARANHMAVRGHPLVFPTSSYAIADWVEDAEHSREELLAIMDAHVTQIVGHYRGQIEEWVVVNEPYLVPQRTRDVFHRTIGEEYIEIAFQAARDADPSALLIYNDTDNHTESGLTTALTRANLEPLMAKGLVDAVGLHMHLDGARPPRKEDLISTMQRYELPVYVTELDVNLKNVAGTQDDRYDTQARIYGEVVEACLESGVCESITFWDVGDKYAWGEWPAESSHTSPNADMTLFDDNLAPKPAYGAVRNVLARD